MNHCRVYLGRVSEVAESLDAALLETLAGELAALRDRRGRLFLLGVGGSAANASHAVNDFRKIAGIEAYTPSDNVAELTARTNDEGWETVFSAWLEVSNLRAEDALLVFSVGGGSLEKNISPNLVRAVQLARARGARIFGIVGRDGGYTKQVGDVVIVVPTVDPGLVTPLSEAFQAVLWHALVSHPALKQRTSKWESVSADRHASSRVS